MHTAFDILFKINILINGNYKLYTENCRKWRFCCCFIEGCDVRILTTVHKVCDKGLYATYGEHYNL
jgi:hypothetical protein